MLERFKNILSPKKTILKEELQSKIDDLIQGFEYFGLSSKMAKDIFTETNLTIHQEKIRCKKAYSDNSFMQTAVNNLISILMGDNPEIWSENKIFKEYAKKWYGYCGCKRATRQAIKQAIISGDGYIKKLKGNKGSYKYCNIENAEDIYIEWNHKENRPLRFIERLYYTEAQARKLNLKTFTLKMPWGTETIQGIEHSPDEIIHFQFMENKWGVYGRSPIASVLNDIEVINRMERSIAVISMFKAIPQKLLMPDTTAEDEVMDKKQVEGVINVLKSAKDFESPVIGKRMSALNLTDSGQAIDLTGYLEYFKRKISICLSPEFIIHGELVNRNTSVEQKQIFYLSILSLRNEFKTEIDEMIREGLLASISVLESEGVKIPRATFEFIWGEYDIELRQEKSERLLKEWREGLITHTEYRQEFDYKEDELFGDNYSWELRLNQEANAINELKKAIDDGIPQNKN